MSIPRSLYFDISGFIADSVVNRSVEFVRVGAYARTTVLDEVTEIGIAENANSYTFTGAANNSLTMVKAPLPVDITVTVPGVEEGDPPQVTKLLQQKLMILNTKITSLLIENVAPNTIPVQVHILHT